MEWDAKLILSDIGINYTSEGDNVKVRRVSSISTDATEDDLAFCFYHHGEKRISLVRKTRAAAILCTKALEGLVHPTKSGRPQLFFVENPKFTLIPDAKFDVNDDLFSLERVTFASNWPFFSRKRNLKFE